MDHRLTSEEQTAMVGFAMAQQLVHQTAVEAGWYVDLATGKTKVRNFGEVIALMHSELSEALEGHRKGGFDEHIPDRSKVEVELADCIIRIMDTAQALGLDLAGAIIAKNRYNKVRADHKLSARRDGGKQY